MLGPVIRTYLMNRTLRRVEMTLSRGGLAKSRCIREKPVHKVPAAGGKFLEGFLSVWLSEPFRKRNRMVSRTSGMTADTTE